MEGLLVPLSGVCGEKLLDAFRHWLPAGEMKAASGRCGFLGRVCSKKSSPVDREKIVP